MKIYVASSWRNDQQKDVVSALRKEGHEVYDFKNPAPNVTGFSWSEIDKNWQEWTPAQFRSHLACSPIAMDGFHRDWQAMLNADACVLVMPCGRSAHIEAGYFVGAGKPLLILLSDGEPELMYRMASNICLSISEVIEDLNDYRKEVA